jgi:DNA-binding IclR family transcriptional regulator
MEETGANGLELLSSLFRQPLVNVNRVSDEVEVSFPTANRLVARFEELGLLREVTGQRRSRMFRYEPYLALRRSGRSLMPVFCLRGRVSELHAQSGPAGVGTAGRVGHVGGCLDH